MFLIKVLIEIAGVWSTETQVECRIYPEESRAISNHSAVLVGSLSVV